MHSTAIIVMSFLFVFGFGFITGKSLLTKNPFLYIIKSFFGFAFSFVLYWMMLYFLRDTSLYDVYRSMLRTTLGIVYFTIFCAYITIYIIGIWVGELSESMEVVSI